ncbi:MAG: tripartite tricarboxylate transporter substrate binding protein [Betaproteobacteria bacterium]|nr:tripartite tricarboxylate transporter substrate binding protein [Betaproteobacteria bacterium]
MHRSFGVHCAAIIAALLLASAAAPAQEFPSRPIRILVPFPPGGSGDTLTRLVGVKLTESWKQQVIVENRPGGNTIIASELVSKSSPDGHTLLLAVDSTMTMNPSLYAKLPYTLADFAPIALLAEQSLLLSVNPSKIAARNFQEFVAYAKAHPGKINLGTGAIVSQVTVELIKAAAGIDIVIVPFKGGPESLQNLLGGSIEASLSDITPYVPHIREGRLRAIALSRARRSASLPEVPTIAESGYPEIDAHSWFGLFAPAATPPAVVSRLNAEVNRILQLPDVSTRLAGVGLEVARGSPEQFTAIIRSQSEKMSRVIKAAGIRLE